MAVTKVMKLWAALITAVLAAFAALGFTTPASAAVPAQKSEEHCNDVETALDVMEMTPAHFVAREARSLPPTMKQRIAAEAHGSSPSCRRAPTNRTAPQEHRTSEVPRQEAAPGLAQREQAAPLPDPVREDPRQHAPSAPELTPAHAPEQAPDRAPEQAPPAAAPAGSPATALTGVDPVSDADAVPDASVPDHAAGPFPSQRQSTGEPRPSAGASNASAALSPTVVHQARPNVYEDPTAALLAGSSGQILS